MPSHCWQARTSPRMLLTLTYGSRGPEPLRPASITQPRVPRGQLAARRLQLHEYVKRGAKQQMPLFGEDQSARVAMEQRHRELLLQGADLPRYRRLRKPELLAGVGKASRLCSRVKDFQLVPIHVR